MFMSMMETWGCCLSDNPFLMCLCMSTGEEMDVCSQPPCFAVEGATSLTFFPLFL
jgi:hypothetical protein